MSSGVAPAPFEVRRRLTIERHYHGLAAGYTKRNTFAGATIALEPPCYRLQSAGAIAETSKLLEVALESIYNDESGGGLPGPGSTIVGDFRRNIKCLMHGSADTPANVSGAWCAIGYGSFDANTPPAGAGGTGYLQLRRSLTSPADFTVISRTGDSTTAPETATFTIEDATSSLVEIQLDPFALSARVYVGGVLRWTLSDSAKYPGNPGATFAYPAPMVEMLLWSGTQTGASVCRAIWSGVQVIDYGLDQVGSGLV